MSYFPASLFVETERWQKIPPTGAELRNQLERYFSSRQYLADLSRLSGRSSDSIAWHLGQDAVLPAGLWTAALRWRRESCVGRPDGPPRRTS